MSWKQGEGGDVRTLPEPEPESLEGIDRPPALPAARVSPWRRGAAVAVVVALASGVGWQLTRDKGSSDGPTSPTPVSTSSTIDVPTIAPTDRSTPPALRNSGDDFDTIVRSVNDFQNWVEQFDPDPKWVSAYTDPLNKDGFERETKHLADLMASGHHYDGPALKVRKVIVRHRVTDEQIAVYTVYEGLPANIVDGDGKVVTAQPSLAPTGFLEDWVRGDDGRWRLFHTEVLGPPAPEILR